MEKLKQRWGVKTNFQILIIFLVFSINGSFAVYIGKPLLGFLGLVQGVTNPFLFWPVRILLIFTIYQITLVIVGTLFGQFKFFWAFEKKMLKRIGFKRFFKD
ncbi:MAG: diacylglyceryl transferase [Flavobacteriaceae bacterium]|nr:diacylglyceryl transferase [Flavobacteriaceae bacterium]